MSTESEAFRTSATTDKLDAALAKAQAEIQTAKKDHENPHFKSKYADLTSIWAACRAALAKNGIAVSQWPIHSTDTRLHLVTRLACSGEWMLAHFSIPVQKADAHGYGSATTYAKRFALSAAVGVVGDDDDDDGNAAVEVPARRAAPKPKAEPIATAAANGTDAKAKVAALWKEAQRRGVTREAWPELTRKVLGTAKPHEQWTDEDLEAVENALPSAPPQPVPVTNFPKPAVS